jgi:hypothetical protein
MRALELALLVFALGGASFPLLAWLLGTPARMRQQRRDAAMNRVLGGGR